MRIFSSARIVVLDADPKHRAFLCGALEGLGLSHLLPAASAEEARALAASVPVDLCVVSAPGLPRAAAPFPPNPFDPARTPAILIAAGPARETARLAAAQGYRLVLPAPAVPRILYRRIGSVLQKVRRAHRVRPPELAPLSPVRAPELRQT